MSDTAATHPAPHPGEAQQASGERPPRWESHALLDVRLHAWNPFSSVSAVLLDISWQGFKMEFVNPVRIKPGSTLQIYIPLSPFNIQSPSRLKLKVTVKWFDVRNWRAGGVFLEPSGQQLYILEKIINLLAARKHPINLPKNVQT